MQEYIAALAVLADPNASDDEKAAALDKLTAYFNAQLDAEESTETETASESGETETEKTSAAGDEKEEAAKEMTSALAAANESIKTLTERLTKVEKASAVGTRQRASKPTILQRTPAKPAPSAHETVAIEMIDRAAKNTIRMTGK